MKQFWSVCLASVLVGAPAYAQPAGQQAGTTPAARTNQQRPPGKRRGESPEAAKKRDQALRSILAKLHVGVGRTVADIGAGRGRDSWVFAEIVGPEGRVYAEEIVEKLVESLKQEVERRKLRQVQPVLGKTDSPCLPQNSVDVEYMHYVYHHFAQPRTMLAGLWHGLKPGGYLVIVDRHRGTLRDWVAREERGKKHYWIAETTVVRDAREAGFAFVGCGEDMWPDDDQFVLIFQRPRNLDKPGTDPDQPLPLDLKMVRERLLPKAGTFQQPVFVALGEARKLMMPIMQQSAGPGLDVVLEEWATTKTERPWQPAGVTLPTLLTSNGDVDLGDAKVGAVFFLDTYHLLFYPQKLLQKLHAGLSTDGIIVVLDRKAPLDLSRRLASHRRRIPAETVKQEMAAAGFKLRSEPPAPAADRFLLVFEKDTTR